MADENSDLLVHDVIGRLFEEPEPTHRADLADGAIAHGMAVTRRRGFAVAGATLSVLAVVAGAVALAGGSGGAGGDDWSLGLASTAKTTPQAYEDAGPTYADRQREIVERLPALVGTLFGLKLSADQRVAGGVTSMATGDFAPGVAVDFAGGKDVVRFDGADDSGYTAAFARTSAAPIQVTGGTIRVAVVPGGSESGRTSYSAWYEFVPADKTQPPVRFSILGDGKTSPIGVTEFKKMVAAPAFADLQKLLNPAVPASAEVVQQRYAVEAKINAEAVKVLPPGFRLKLNPGVPGGLELVGPDGVDTFEWAHIEGSQQQISCSSPLCYAAHNGGTFRSVDADGKARLGVYAGWTAGPKSSSVVVSVFGKSKTGADVDPAQMGKPAETAPQGPGLTPQQAMSIVKAPGVAKVIDDVLKLAAVY